MKIAFLNSCRYIGGAELWQIRFARWLASQGEEVRFFLRPGKFSELVKKEGFELSEIPMRFDLDLASIFQLYLGLKRFSPEVVLLNDQRELRLGAPAGRLARVPLIIQRKGWSYLKGSFRDRLYYRLVDYVIYITDEIKLLFKTRLGMEEEKLVYFPNGINLEEFSPAHSSNLRQKIGAENDELVLGMSGRLVRQKRQEDLIRAGKLLLERGFKLRIALAGEGKLEPELKSLAEKIGISSRVHFLGFLSRVQEFLAGIDIFVFCSEQEGMPNSVLEAMAMAKPIVVADIPGVRELIESGREGLLYPPGEVNLLAEKIEAIIKNPELARALGESARKKVEKKFDEKRLFCQLRNWLWDQLKKGK